MVPGPGIAKVRKTKVVARRTVRLVAVIDGWWSGMLEHADVVSEGGTVMEGDREVYYGTTSILCDLEPVPQEAAEMDVDQLAAVIMSDPHARLRLLRLAHREAASRSGGAIGELSAEMIGYAVRREGKHMLAIDFDVNAPVATAVLKRRGTGA